MGPIPDRGLPAGFAEGFLATCGRCRQSAARVAGSFGGQAGCGGGGSRVYSRRSPLTRLRPGCSRWSYRIARGLPSGGGLGFDIAGGISTWHRSDQRGVPLLFYYLIVAFIFQSCSSVADTLDTLPSDTPPPSPLHNDSVEVESAVVADTCNSVD